MLLETFGLEVSSLNRSGNFSNLYLYSSVWFLITELLTFSCYFIQKIELSKRSGNIENPQNFIYIIWFECVRKTPFGSSLCFTAANPIDIRGFRC